MTALECWGRSFQKGRALPRHRSDENRQWKGNDLAHCDEVGSGALPARGAAPASGTVRVGAAWRASFGAAGVRAAATAIWMKGVALAIGPAEAG